MNLAYRILPDGLPSGNMVKGGGSVAEIARFPKANLPDQIEDFGKAWEIGGGFTIRITQGGCE